MVPKRVLLVEQNRDGTIGGSHHSLLILVQQLDRSRFEPVVGFYEDNSLMNEFAKVARVVKLPVSTPLSFGRQTRITFLPVRLVLMAAQKIANAIRDAIATIARVVTVVRIIRPDLIHLNNSVHTAGLTWFITARLSGARWITHHRGYASPALSAYFIDRVICISRAVKADLLARAPWIRDRVVQIYNGIDTDAFARQADADCCTVRQEFGIGSDEIVLGLVGNLQAWKGQDVLVRALPLLTRKNWRCLLVGDVPAEEANRSYYAHVRDLVGSLGLDGRVQFTGYRADVARMVAAFDIMVHTSVEPEPMGRVILEGMALGTVVVATDHGGPQEIIEHGESGFLVPPGDPIALAACLDELITSAALRARIAPSARHRIETLFSASEYARQVQDVYLSFWPDLRPAAYRSSAPISSSLP